MKDIKKIVITGGPCAGKSTAIPSVKESLEAMGYTVLLIPEVATELITNGISPISCKSQAEYQKHQLILQTAKERLYYQAALGMDSEKIVIVCDRGAMDSKAYIPESEFLNITQKLGLNETELRDGYDAVFHLVSAAKGMISCYSLSDNEARTESAREAAELDDLTLAAWTGNPHLRVIETQENFSHKVRELIKQIMFFLGEPEPLEIERKFLIEYPDISFLESYPFCKGVKISQSYLQINGERVRLRKRGDGNGFTYYKTIKKNIDGIKRIEIESKLSKDEYELLINSFEKGKTVEKTRYCLVFQNQYFEIDVFPFSNEKAFMEIELTEEDGEIKLPPFIKVIADVSCDKNYRNSIIADKICNGIIPF